MKVRIRQKSATAPLRIKIREKEVFFCKDCSNKYYSLLFFCPQCLGEIAVPRNTLVSLKIVSVPSGKKSGTIALLQELSGKSGFPFEKSLRSLPWVMILETDPAVLLHWKEILEALTVVVEIIPSPKKGRRKQPLFESDAPLPFFIPKALKNAVCRISMKFRNTPTRLRWVEAVFSAVKLIESLHKQYVIHRPVFGDFILRIERDLEIMIQNIDSGLTDSESLEEEIRQFRESVEAMRSDVEAVGRQVRDQL